MRRFTVAVAVYGLLFDADRVLLLRRAGSGYHDGELSLPAGHLDGGEDVVSGLVRELREELTINVESGACELAVVAHRAPEHPDDHEYLDLFFTVAAWDGHPAIGEPDKCSELVWAKRDDLPDGTDRFIVAALHSIGRQQILLLRGWSG